MNAKPAAARDLTPFGKLAETGVHQILGYQLAQATITAHRVFSAHLALAPPNITVWMERLESRGLVERERSTSDRRSQHIRTTAAGATLARDAARRIVEGEDQALAGLSAAERAMLVELLHKVARSRQET